MAVANHVIEVSEASFQTEVIERSKTTPVVVDFWAPWCGPCRMLGPMLERLAGEGGGSFVLAKINVDNNQGLSVRYGVQGIPAVKGFRGGKVAAEFVGAQPEPNVRRFLKQLVPDETTALLAEGRWAEAETALRRALDSRPGQPGPTLGLVRALIGQGKGAEADSLLGEFPSSAEQVEAEALRPLAAFMREGGEPDEGELPPLEAQYRQAARLAARGQYGAALDGLLDVLRQNKRYRDGEPRRVVLAIFKWLGEDDPLTDDYRRELASVLF